MWRNWRNCKLWVTHISSHKVCAISPIYENKIFVVKKPLFLSSAQYLGRIKRKYQFKKIGFSGTLDPFASGTLICASGQFTKLFSYLQKTPKVYVGTIWLGATSDSLDIENVSDISPNKKLHSDDIINVLGELAKRCEIEYIPPKYSAKKVNGKRAYALAREDKEVELKTSLMQIFDLSLVNYSHPFITYRAAVSEGSYIRSLSQIILSNLGAKGTMSYLRREQEGLFAYENEKFLDVLAYLDLETNECTVDAVEKISYGKKLDVSDFKNKNNGIYMLNLDGFLSIIKIEDSQVSYLLNRIKAC